MRLTLVVLVVAGVVGGAGCGPQDGGLEVAGYRLQMSGGTYADGSGRRGLALIATFRDVRGQGPSDPWTVTLSDAQGPLALPVTYSSASPGSMAAWWWPDLGLAGGEEYSLKLERADGVHISGMLQASFGDGLAPPQVDLSADGSRLSWQEVPGAESYACRIYSQGQLHLSTYVQAPECDVSALPPGSYSAGVLAFSADIPALMADVSPTPSLPLEFHASEGRLAFAIGGSLGTIKASVVGGGLHYGAPEPGLAIWLSLTLADGTPLAERWTVDVVGPGLSADRPLRLSYPASARRFLVWSYEVPALEGRYTIAATSSAGALSSAFTIGQTPQMPMVTDAVASAQPSGGAQVTWSAVTGASTYFVSAWHSSTGALTSSLWVTMPTANFPPESFTAGQSYSVYVAATNVDIQATEPPAQISVSENTYLPASFVAE